jgi:hypothetical protein
MSAHTFKVERLAKETAMTKAFTLNRGESTSLMGATFFSSGRAIASILPGVERTRSQNAARTELQKPPS